MIELLVVIIIIGILAAIAIPVFMKQRQGAYDSAAKSDLHTLAQFQEARLAGGVEYGSFAELALDELPMRPTQKRHADDHQARGFRLLPERQAPRLVEHVVLGQPVRRPPAARHHGVPGDDERRQRRILTG